MPDARTRSILAIAVVALALFLIACDDNDAAPTPAASPTAAENVVLVSMTAGCDRPQPERGTEALALVNVTYPDGVPVVDAQVDGRIEGPGVTNETATDAAVIGEALLFFLVTEPGPYTITVTRVTLPSGEIAAFDPSSTLTTTYDIGEVCTPP